jgi:hypothetical protein
MRADGICPRCKNPVGAPVESVPAAPAPGGTAAGTPAAARPSYTAAPAPAPSRPNPGGLSDVFDGNLPSRGGPGTYGGAAMPADGISGAARIAGGVMLLNGLALLAEMAVLPGAGVGGARLGAAVIDLLLGGALLAGQEKFVVWACVRAGLGLVVGPFIHLSGGNRLLAVIQVAYSLALLVLLIGRAGRVRAVLGTSVLALYLALEGVGLIGTATGSNPLARWTLSQDVEPGTVTTVTGATVPYQLSFPEGRWYARKAEAVKKDNPMAEHWLVIPSSDAHVMVIAEELPLGQSADMDQFAQVVLQNARKAIQNLEVIKSEPLRTSLESARLVHTRGSARGLKVETYYGLYIQGGYIIQVIAFSPEKAFPDVESDFRQILSSMSMS